MPCPTTSRRSPPSGAVSSGCGGGASAGAARKTAPPGRRSTGSSLDGFPNPASLILGQKSASPSPTQGGSRMPESGTSGSVRGVRSNAHPYRDKHATTPMQRVLVLRGQLLAQALRGSTLPLTRLRPPVFATNLRAGYSPVLFHPRDAEGLVHAEDTVPL